MVITLRNLPPELVRMIRRRAAERKMSLTKATISLLEEGAGIRRKKEEQVFHDLDDLAGSWSREEAEAFDTALREQRTINPDLWK